MVVVVVVVLCFLTATQQNDSSESLRLSFFSSVRVPCNVYYLFYFARFGSLLVWGLRGVEYPVLVFLAMNVKVVSFADGLG